jgi:hypothetical protein
VQRGGARIHTYVTETPVEPCHVAQTRREALTETLRRGQAAGEVRCDTDIGAAAETLMGTFFARYLSGEPFDPDWANRAVDVIWRGVSSRTTTDRD